MNQRREALRGNAGSDPDVNMDVRGDLVAKFRLAVNDYGDPVWYTVICQKPVSDFVRRNVKKGCHVFVEGLVELRDWTDRQGKRFSDLQMRAAYIETPDGRAGTQGAKVDRQDKTAQETDEQRAIRYMREQDEYPHRWNKISWQDTPAGREWLEKNAHWAEERARYLRGEREIPKDVSTDVDPEAVARALNDINRLEKP